MADTETPPVHRVLFSLWDTEKTQPAANLAGALKHRGYTIVASGGTKRYIEKAAGIPVTDTAELTGLEPVLDHRVATLTPQLHGGLLAETKHIEELGRLGWPWIQMVVVTFYPLEEKMADPDASFDDINKMVDVGGPVLATSASKGDRIVIVDPKDFRWAKDIVEEGRGFSDNQRRWLQTVATARVVQYRAAEALFRVRGLRP